MRHRAVSLPLLAMALSCLLHTFALGQSEQSPSSDRPVAARVNGFPIYVSQIDAAVSRMPAANRATPLQTNLSRAQLLESLIGVRLATQVLAEDTTLYKQEEVDQKMKEIERAAEKQGKKLSEMVAQQGITLEQLRQEVIFNIAANRYLESRIADALEGYFNEHKAELDGSEIRARHIMLRPENYNETNEQLVARAEAIRADIAAGKLDFAAAASRYSQAPSRERGGDIGFVPRHGVMVESFGAALFKLKPGELSQPVTTPMGVHIIEAVEIKPGNKSWTQVVPEIRKLVSTEEMEKLVRQERAKAKIEYTGLAPHFKPGTRELVTPE